MNVESIMEPHPKLSRKLPSKFESVFFPASCLIDDMAKKKKEVLLFCFFG